MHKAVIAGSIVAATLTGGVAAEPVEGDRLAAISDDTVLLAGDGTLGNDTLGNDTLGNDHLVAPDGNDSLLVPDGNDSLLAPAGDDTLVVSGDDTR
jgi:Ca2+-binding RTX toxin-like protein